MIDIILAIIMAAISFFTAKANGMSDGAAAVTAAGVGLGTYALARKYNVNEKVYSWFNGDSAAMEQNTNNVSSSDVDPNDIVDYTNSLAEMQVPQESRAGFANGTAEIIGSIGAAGSNLITATGGAVQAAGGAGEVGKAIVTTTAGTTAISAAKGFLKEHPLLALGAVFLLIYALLK